MYNERKFEKIEFLGGSTMATIGERIKALRKSNNLTQTEFGKLFGIGKTTVSSYETGNSCPNDDIKLAICKYFDVSTDYLLGLRETTHTSSPTFSGFIFSFEESDEFDAIISRLSKVDIDKVSESTNISSERLEKIQSAEIIPTPSELVLLAKYFDCSVDHLLGKDDLSRPDGYLATDEDVRVALFDGDKDVTPEMWEEVKNFAKYVKAKHKNDGK